MTAATPSPVAVVVTSTEAGGAEAYLTDLYAHPAIAAEFPASLVGAFPGWEATGLPTRDLGLGRKWGYRSLLYSLRTLPRVVAEGRRTLRETAATDGIRLFHMQYKREQVLYTRAASRLAPVVWTEHGHLPQGRLRGPLLMAYRRAARHARAIICVSRAVADEVSDVVGNGPEIVVIETAIDPGWLTPPDAPTRRAARAVFGVTDDATLVVASVGRLVALKRTDLLVDAFRLLPQDAALLISGQGPQQTALQTMAGRDDRVRMLGRWPDTRDVYRAADVVVIPSRSEGFPIVALEAAAAGCPVVVIADAGLDSVVEGWGAVAAGTAPEAIAEAIRVAAGLPRDAPRAWAERHSRAAWAQAHLEVFRRVAATG